MTKTVVVILLLLYECLFPSRATADDTLKGSRAALIKQNLEADKSNLSRIENDVELERFIKLGLLVKIPELPGITINPKLQEKYRYVRPCVADYLRWYSDNIYSEHSIPLQINSAVRTIERQKQLAETNWNAAPFEGETRSSHLTGSTIDIAKKPLTRAQIKFLRTMFKMLKKKDVMHVTEEFSQAVFHVMVFERYSPDEVHIALR